MPRNTISYNAAIAACAKGEAWRPALALFDAMSKAGVARDRVTYNAAIRALENGGQDRLAFELRMAADSELGVKDGGAMGSYEY